MAAEPTTDASAVEPPRKRSLGRTYWLCNVIETWERLAYYTLRPIAPIYICQATEPGGLHLPQQTKGWIYAWWAFFQSILPMITGGYADRYGYKRTLAFSVTLNIAGYLVMALTHSYHGFFAGIIMLAIGTAFFKPSLQGTIAHQLTKEDSSLGWGIFYWVVNVGSVIGHYVSPFLLGAEHGIEGWRRVFLFCAGCTAMNYLMLFTFKDVPSGADKTRNPIKVFATTIESIWPYWFRGGRFHLLRGLLGIVMALGGLAVIVLWNTQWLIGVALLVVGVGMTVWLRGGEFTWQLRLPVWLAIMSCFWLMMYQLWDLQPNYIEDWIDSSMIAQYVPDAWPFDKLKEIGPDGRIRVPQQVLISLNALLIVVFMIPVSWMVRKMRALSAMFFGMVVATSGLLVAGLTGNGWILLLGILFFSLGEMLTGPKKNEYLGLIAPPGKKGLYLGYVNIPVGAGVFVGSWMAGQLYGAVGEKATLALKYLMEHTPFGKGRSWDGAVSTLESAAGVSRTEAFTKLQEVLGTDGVQATQLLWDTYNPQYKVWIPFAAIGVVAAIALAIFGQLAKRWKDMNA